MKRTLTALAALACAGQAFASDPMAGRIGNTVKVTDKDGKVTAVQYRADKTVTVRRPDGDVIQGTWAIVDGKICVTATVLLIPITRCNPFVPDKKPGDVWAQKDADGNDVTATIIPGQQ
jgi:hypothetical protein